MGKVRAARPDRTNNGAGVRAWERDRGAFGAAIQHGPPRSRRAVRERAAG
jgi:hypothetical protein